MTWIPVSERLPEVGVCVLTFESDGGIWVSELVRDEKGERWTDPATGQPEIPNVTHWQPLPEPPTKD